MSKPAKQYHLESVLMTDPVPVVLENWVTDLRKEGLYLIGTVHGHPRFADGKTIRTLRVLWIRDDLGIAQTESTNFILRDRR